MRSPQTLALVFLASVAGCAGCIWLQTYLIKKTDPLIERWLARRRR